MPCCHSLVFHIGVRGTNPTVRWWFQPQLELLCVAVCEGVCVYVPSHLEPTKHAESNDEKEVRRTQQWRHQVLTWYIQQSWQDPRLHSSRRHSFFHTHILILGITHQLQFTQGWRYQSPHRSHKCIYGCTQRNMEQSLPRHLQQVLTVPWAIPMNLLRWGCDPFLDKLEVFLHKSICCILKISMFWVIKKLRNEQVRTSFFAMPCVKNMIAARQLDYSGKLIRGPHDQPARRMITSCCNETRRVGRLQRTEKNCIVKSLRLLFKDVPL